MLEDNFELLASINSYEHNYHVQSALTSGILYSFKVAAVNNIGEGPRSDIVSHFAQAKPVKAEQPYRVQSRLSDDELTAEIELAWYPILETGGVPLTGFLLY